MNTTQKAFIANISDEAADELLVSITRSAMQKKLDKKRDEGYHGWHCPTCNNEALKEALVAHIEKGDMIDVINFAAMIYVREKLYGDEA